MISPSCTCSKKMQQCITMFLIFIYCLTCSSFIVIPSYKGRSVCLFATIPSNELETKTIKELKQLLKDSNILERGVLSKLTRKKDIIQYIQHNLPEYQSSTLGASISDDLQLRPPTLVSESDSPQKTVPIPKVRPGRMPELRSPNKDDMLELIYNTYPPLRDENCTNLGEEDVRQKYHPMLRNNTGSDMDLITVGTASCAPGITRGVSCTALRLNWQRRYVPTDANKDNQVEHTGFVGGTWLFDAGECTQLQVQRTNRIKPGKITKIFLTHAHGDHTFGLPGLMCLMGQDRSRDSPPVEIYGPEGLRMWLRVAIRYSVSRIVPPYRVHEVMNIPMAPEWRRIPRKSPRYFNSLRLVPGSEWGSNGLAGEDAESWISQANKMPLDPSFRFGEIAGGRDIYPQYGHPLAFDGAPVWEIEDEDDVKVYAAPMSHGVPCLGYVVDEQSRPGRLRSEFVEPIVKRNVEALKASGFKIPMRAMAVIKNLAPGSSFTFPDGTVVSQEDAVEAPRSGRKVVVCGDTSDARALTKLAMDADVVVHEATNTYLDFLDKNDQDIRSVTKDSMTHGHSTPQMAAKFAKKVNARLLLMNHFSPRYKGDQAADSISIMTRLEHQAMQAGGFDESQVASAWDFMLLPIPQK